MTILAPADPSPPVLAELAGRPSLDVLSRQAWAAIAAQGDPGNAWRWAESMQALLHANAGAACLAAVLRLRGTPAELADAAEAITTICRHAGATQAIACIDAWDRLRSPGLWPAMIRLAHDAPDCIASAAARAGTVLQAVGSDGFVGFVALGLRAAGRDKVRRAAFFELTDRLARRALAQGSGGGLADLERGLKLFATALWGQSSAMRPLPAAPNRPAARRTSLSDGVILLPESFPGLPPAAQPRLYRAAVAHAIAHLMAGTQRQPVGSLKPLQLAIIALIEDARVEALALRRFPGLRRLWAPYHVAQAEGVTAPSLLARLARALFDPAYADSHGFVTKGVRLFAEADLQDTAAPRRIGSLLGNDLGQMRIQFNARTYVVEPAYRDDGLGLWDFGTQSETPPDLLEMKVEAARVRQEAGNGRTEGSPDAAPGAARARPVAAASGGVLLGRYPEWDPVSGVERPEWSSVLEIPALLGDPRQLDAMLDASADLRHRVARLVRAARPGRPQRLKGQPDGIDLDMDAVVDAEAMRNIGVVPSDRLYRATSLRTRDLATLVLVDVSESARAGGILDIERHAVALLADAMSGLGDPFALLAFASDGREQVRLTRIKAFEEPFATPARARLAGLRPGLSTRLGAALRHAGSEMAGVRAFRRLVLVLTDGEPSDIDVANPLDLVEDGRRAVLGLRSRGIDSFAVVLGTHGAETAARMFGRSGHVALRRLEDLPARLSDLYFRLSRR